MNEDIYDDDEDFQRNANAFIARVHIFEAGTGADADFWNPNTINEHQDLIEPDGNAEDLTEPPRTIISQPIMDHSTGTIISDCSPVFQAVQQSQSPDLKRRSIGLPGSTAMSSDVQAAAPASHSHSITSSSSPAAASNGGACDTAAIASSSSPSDSSSSSSHGHISTSGVVGTPAHLTETGSGATGEPRLWTETEEYHLVELVMQQPILYGQPRSLVTGDAIVEDSVGRLCAEKMWRHTRQQLLKAIAGDETVDRLPSVQDCMDRWSQLCEEYEAYRAADGSMVASCDGNASRLLWLSTKLSPLDGPVPTDDDDDDKPTAPAAGRSITALDVLNVQMMEVLKDISSRLRTNAAHDTIQHDRVQTEQRMLELLETICTEMPRSGAAADATGQQQPAHVQRVKNVVDTFGRSLLPLLQNLEMRTYYEVTRSIYDLVALEAMQSQPAPE